MPCHARAAAQSTPSLSHLWITDELLADAFNRFTRVSHTARRYGSNVPGPLEARRRLAKRRMGMAAVSAAGVAGAPPPGIDLAALFGLRNSRPLEKSLKWEPPSLHQPVQFGSPPPPPLPWPWSFGHRKESISDGKMLLDDVPEVDPIESSKSSFRDLLSAIAHASPVDVNELEPLVHFLQSSKNEPRAQNVMRLSRWLASRDVSEEAVHVLDEMVADKLRLETIDHIEASDYILHVLRQRIPNTALRISAILGSSRNNQMKRIIYSVTRQCLARTLDNDKLAKSQITAAWLGTLRHCEHLQGPHHGNALWFAVYSILATDVRPSAISAHFHHLNPPDLCRILLSVWVPRIARAPTERYLTHQCIHTWKPSLSDDAKVDIDAIMAEFEASHARDSKLNPKYRSTYSLVHLLTVMARHGVPYDQLLVEIFEILRSRPETFGKHAVPRTVFNVFMEVCKRDELGVPSNYAATLVDYFIKGRNNIMWLRMAWHVFTQVPTIPFSEFKDLPLRMAKAGAGPLEVFRLLQRSTTKDNVTLRFGQRPFMTLTEDRIDLVHIIAHRWAHSPRSTCRVAYRRVWACYRFLQDRGAPLNDIMSRAMVHAGALRYLMEGRRVPTVQFRYILSLVRRLEGDQIANELDRAMWTLWNKQVRPQMVMKAMQGFRKILPGDDGDAVCGQMWASGRKKPWTRAGPEAFPLEARPWGTDQLLNVRPYEHRQSETGATTVPVRKVMSAENSILWKHNDNNQLRVVTGTNMESDKTERIPASASMSSAERSSPEHLEFVGGPNISHDIVAGPRILFYTQECTPRGKLVRTST